MDKYPWITFKVNLKSLSCSTWIQLGECLSKCEHISQVPLNPDVAQEMHKVYLTKGVSATTAIEGNTLSEEEVRQIIEKKLKVLPSREYLQQEVENILQLCNELKDKMSNGKNLLINLEEICRLNRIILQKVPCPDYVVPGEFRTVPIGVGSYKAVDHCHINNLMMQLCDWLNSDYFNMPNTHIIITSIIKAIATHLYIEWIHPFGDGNGRVGRLLEFAILIYSGVSSPAAHLLSNHYNTTRNEYYRQLDIAGKKRDINDFIAYAVQGLRDGLVEQLKYIFKQVLDTSWENYIYDTFKEHKRSEKPARRMRALVIALSRQNEPVSRDRLTMLSAKLIELYKGSSSMTLSRDINELIQLDLIEKTNKGYKAKTEKMLAFIPSRASVEN